VVFCHLARRITEAGQRIAIVVHRQELVDQTCAALAAEGLAYKIIAAGYPKDMTAAPILVCMAQTLARRDNRLDGIQYLILDEALHVVATTWRTILDRAPRARVLGVTATPERLDGKGLKEVFSALVIGPTVKQLITEGWLSRFTIFAPERTVDLKGIRTVAGDYALGDLAQRMGADAVLGDAAAEYRKHLNGGTAIAFCVTIEHSRAVARLFRAHGIEAQHLDGDTPAAERRLLLEMLGTGTIKVICNCALISEGLDIPSVSGVILLRPTKSLALHLQQIGRALRPAPEKQRTIILDHAGNTFRHGMPDLEHQWSLEGRPKTKGQALVRRCPKCGAIIPIAAQQCPECGADLRPKLTKPISTPERLIELDPATAFGNWLATGPFQAVMHWAGEDEARLHRVAQARGYKRGWVWWRLNGARQNTAFGE
jgi:superfamily II DNA or RNA helicase